MPYRCHYCGAIHCKQHRLPENHDCDGVEFLSPPGRRFRDKTTGRVVQDGDSIQAPEPIEPKYSVGTRPDPEYESSPDVELTTEAKLRRLSENASTTNERKHPEFSEPVIDRVLSWIKSKWM